MKISIFGLGYVGCVSLGCLAENGFNTIGVDVSEYKVDLINNGISTIVEKDIDAIISRNVTEGKIYATTDYKKAVLDSDAAIICVGTPSTESGRLDLSYIYKVAEQIGEALKEKKEFYTVFIRSTVPPGTNEKVRKIIKLKIEDYKIKDNEIEDNKIEVERFGVVSNPEFLREGTAVYDYYNPPYTVIASDSVKALEVAGEIYSKIKAPVISASVKSAEILKYINNSFHALKVTFANEVGNICKRLGIDSHEVMEIFLKDDKLNISPYYLKPGFAYGGSCLPKDLKGLNAFAHELYLDVPVLNSIDRSNKIHIENAVKIISDLNKKKLGFLGISFKPGTDDMRYSPVLELIEHFIGKGYEVKIYDKNVDLSRIVGKNKSFIEEKLPHINNLIMNDLNSLVKESEVIIISNKEKEFEALKVPEDKLIIDLVRIKNLEKNKNYTGICW